MILKKLLFFSMLCFLGNLYSQTVQVVFAQYENGKISSYDTLWFTDHAKKTRFYYYDLDKMQRFRIWGKDTVMTSQKAVQDDLKKYYSKINVIRMKSKPEFTLGLDLYMARIKVVGVDEKNSRTLTVHYLPKKIHKNFYYDDIFKDIPGLILYWSIDDKNFTKAIEITEVDEKEMYIPKLKIRENFKRNPE
ncbi:MAG: hypothetical protein PHR79_00230 [Bacteroidales bacterium]|nr:hypothetical protein [Bacteroidales bacterium]